MLSLLAQGEAQDARVLADGRGARVPDAPGGFYLGGSIGMPAAMAPFPFSGWGDSFFGDLNVQCREGVFFYTQQAFSTWRRPRETLGRRA